jgi:hypothetical protein
MPVRYNGGATVGRYQDTPMPTLELTDGQVVELVRQLPPDRRRAALLALAADGAARRDLRLSETEAGLRRAAVQRGRDWDRMSDDEREAFVDGLVHEDRPCGP